MEKKGIFDKALTLPPLVELFKERLPQVLAGLSNGEPGTCVKDRGLELCPAFRGGKEDGEEERVPHGRGSETGPVPSDPAPRYIAPCSHPLRPHPLVSHTRQGWVRIVKSVLLPNMRIIYHNIVMSLGEDKK